MHNDVKEVLFSEKMIAEKVEEIGKQLTKDFQSDNDLIVVGVLKGANVFMGDLIRKIDLPINIDFIDVSSYGASTESSGVVKIVKDLSEDIADKNVLIVEDIVDTGLTLKYLINNFYSRNAKSVKVCSLLDKSGRRTCEVNIDYKGFDIPNEFIVGYGIDYAEKYRNLPYVATLKPEVYEK